MIKKTGFTLIEMLVTVLIVGILAAIAYPQYHKSVLKTEYVKTTVLVDALWQTAEEYYLANGHYPNNFDYLGTDMPGNCSMEGTGLKCDDLSKKGWGKINMSSWESGSPYAQRITIGKSSGGYQSGLQYQRFFTRQSNPKYTFFNGGYPGMAICTASGDEAMKVCGIVGKVINPGGSYFII